MRISVVVPCHNEAACLPHLLDALEGAAREMRAARPGLAPVELVLVDDGSTDGTLALMRAAAAVPAPRPDLAVEWLSLSRSFGKEAALACGLAHASGELVATMDADLQDPPALLPRMLDALLADPELDCVATRRVTRAGEPRLRSACARLFYRLMARLSDVALVDGARDFRLMRRPMVDALLALPERSRFTKGLYGWVGFRTAWIAYDNVERAAGKSAWGFWGLVRYALGGIVDFSVRPLALAPALGAALLALALLAAAASLACAAPVGGALLMAAILLAGGLNLCCTGILGLYVACVHGETKARPLYVLRRSSFDEGGKAQRARVVSRTRRPDHARRG